MIHREFCGIGVGPPSPLPVPGMRHTDVGWRTCTLAGIVSGDVLDWGIGCPACLVL